MRLVPPDRTDWQQSVFLDEQSAHLTHSTMENSVHVTDASVLSPVKALDWEIPNPEISVPFTSHKANLILLVPGAFALISNPFTPAGSIKASLVVVTLLIDFKVISPCRRPFALWM